MPGAYWILDGFSFGHRRLYTLNRNMAYGWYVGGYRMPPVHPLAITQETAVHIAGQRARVAAHVDGWGPAARRTVNLYARPHGARHGHLVARAHTDRYGNARFAPRLTVSTRLTAVAPAVGGRHRLLGRLTIRPGVRLRDNVHDLAGLTRSTDIMPPGARPAFDVHTFPTHAGQCLFIQLDRGAGNRQWTSIYRGCYHIGTHGRVRYVLPAGLQGLVRIRAVFKGDARNAPAATLWRTIIYQ